MSLLAGVSLDPNSLPLDTYSHSLNFIYTQLQGLKISAAQASSPDYTQHQIFHNGQRAVHATQAPLRL